MRMAVESQGLWDGFGVLNVGFDVEDTPAHEQSCPIDADAPEVDGSGDVHAVLPFRLSFEVHDHADQTRHCIAANPALYYFSSKFHEGDDGVPDASPSLHTIVLCCREIQRRLEDPRLAQRHLIYYCYRKEKHISSSTLLLASYLVLVEGWDAATAAQRFAALHDISPTYGLSLLDHLNGLQRALQSNFWNFEDFDVNEGQFLMHLNMSFICPKFAALHDPVDALDTYLQVLKGYDVSTVVRLNGEKSYHKDAVEEEGFRHHDLYFQDGTAPPLKLVSQFLSICKSEGAVAVHCMAGLGRTGTLIAVWIMRECGWPAQDAIAWLRTVRPGSINEVQHHFLLRYENLNRNYCASIPNPQDVMRKISERDSCTVSLQSWQACEMQLGSDEPVLTRL